MSLTIPQRTGTPSVAMPSPKPTAAKPASAPSPRSDTGPRAFKDGFENPLKGMEPGSRAARQPGGRPNKGDVKEILKHLDPHGVTPEEQHLLGGSNYRRNSREMW